MSLLPCPSCERHVRATEASCPFCGAATRVDIITAPKVGMGQAMGRAAMFTMGAAMLAVSGCSDDTPPDGGDMPLYGGPPMMMDASGMGDGGGPTPAYGGPAPMMDAEPPPAPDAAAPDADVPDADPPDADPPDASPDADPPMMDAGSPGTLYGAPPPSS